MLFEFEKLEILPPNCRVHQPKLRVYHQKAPKLGINIYIDNKSEAVRGDKKKTSNKRHDQLAQQKCMFFCREKICFGLNTNKRLHWRLQSDNNSYITSGNQCLI
jgi:hypothetical protein